MFLNLYLDIRRYLPRYKITPNPGKPAQQSAARDNFIALGQRLDHLLVFPRLLHLGPDQEKIKYREYEHQRQQTHQTAAPRGLVLCPGATHEKFYQHILKVLIAKGRYYATVSAFCARRA